MSDPAAEAPSDLSWDTVEVGTELPGIDVTLTRADLVRYAGASGDFNPIHWDERFARGVGLPDVIAHGMLTMAHAARVLTAWTGDPGRVEEVGARFTNPVVVGYDDGAPLHVGGKITQKLDDGRVRVELTATSRDAKVLGKAYAVVRLR